jgi:hypothetical protein
MFILVKDDSQLDVVIGHHPEVLGDTYEELVESLNRIADAGLKLAIPPRVERGSPAPLRIRLASTPHVTREKCLLKRN